MSRSALKRRIAGALDQSPPRIPVLTGGCGSGLTTILSAAGERRRGPVVFVDVERTATTPERFFDALWQAVGASARPAGGRGSNAREAFEATLSMLACSAGHGGQSITFLLDEILEIRAFESFPGVRGVLAAFTGALSNSPNRFILSTRFHSRARRLLAAAGSPVLLLPVPRMTMAEVREEMSRAREPSDEVAVLVHALADGRPAYVAALSKEFECMARAGDADPVSALAAVLAPGGSLAARCARSYEARLHHARGHGTLKAIIDILAGEQPLTLSEIACRLRRTPGSTRDYLSWLEDVDLVSAEDRRYALSDPLLRAWVRLYCRAVPPGEEEVAREAQEYALGRLEAAGAA